MIYEDFIIKTTEEIEGKITDKINEINEKIISVILGWNDAKTEIMIWFDYEWEDFGYYSNHKHADIIIERPDFAKEIDGIICNEDFIINKTLINYPEYGNSLEFNNEDHNKKYNLIRNAMLQSLVDISRNICKRKKIGFFSYLLSFKALDISSPEHPELTAIYADNGEDALMYVEVDNGDNDFECYCRVLDDSLVFFRVDNELADQWEDVFDITDTQVKIEFDNLENFIIIKNNDYKQISLKIKHLGILDINEPGTNKNHILFLKSEIINCISSKIKEHGKVPEKRQFEISSPQNEAEFNAWCNYLNESNNKFTWRDLEIAVDKYGIEFIYKFIPQFNEKNKYYEVVIVQAVEELIKGGDFDYAQELFQKLSNEKQASKWVQQLDILIGLEKFEEALKLILRNENNDDIGKWDKKNLIYKKSFIFSNQGKVNEAKKLLESVNKEDRNNKFEWFYAFNLAATDQEKALKIVEPFFSAQIPMLINTNQFKKFNKINSLFNHKATLLKNIKSYDATIIKKQRVEKISKESYPFFPLIEINLQQKYPQCWEIINSIELGKLSVVKSIQYNEKYYILMTNGFLYEVYLDNDTFELKDLEKIAEEPSKTFLNNNILYIYENQKPLIVYDLKNCKILKKINRIINQTIDSIYANDDYLSICTILGVELYHIDVNGNYRLIDLLGVGKSKLSYTWAKDSIIINNYLYITAGNGGLVVYQLNGDKKSQYKSSIRCDFSHPFCTNIFNYNNYLVINMEYNHWIVDIKDPENPESTTVLFGRKDGKKTGPVIIDNQLFFVEEEKPVIWNYQADSQNKFKIGCEHVFSNKEQAPVFYYLKEVKKFSDTRMMIIDKYKISLLERKASQSIDDTRFEYLIQKADGLYLNFKKQLDEYFTLHKEDKIGFIMFEAIDDELNFIVIKFDNLIKIKSYSLKSILSINFKLDIEPIPDIFPYYDLYEKKKKEIYYKLSKMILNKFYLNKENYYEDKMYFIFSGYNPERDRSVFSLENYYI